MGTHRKSPERDHEEDGQKRGWLPPNAVAGPPFVPTLEPYVAPQGRKAIKAVLTVTIDVTTRRLGQRDQIESGTRPYKVTLKEHGVVVLENTRGDDSIQFDYEGLEAALKILEDYSVQR